jgi:hypothetical protein
VAGESTRRGEFVVSLFFLVGTRFRDKAADPTACERADRSWPPRLADGSAVDGQTLDGFYLIDLRSNTRYYGPAVAFVPVVEIASSYVPPASEEEVRTSSDVYNRLRMTT